MRVGDTTGIAFLWYTLILQIASASCSIVFLASHGENQVGGWIHGKQSKFSGLAYVQKRMVVTSQVGLAFIRDSGTPMHDNRKGRTHKARTYIRL